MYLIPFPIHIFILIGLCIFAAMRGGPFPLKLTLLYAAFFILSSATYYFIDSRNIDYSVQIVTEFALFLGLFNFASNGPRIKYVKRFCAVMILSMINSIYMFICYISLVGEAYGISTIIHSSVSFFLYLAVVASLIGVINGSSGDIPILKRLHNYFADAFSSMGSNREALPASIWQARAQSESFREKRAG